MKKSNKNKLLNGNDIALCILATVTCPFVVWMLAYMFKDSSDPKIKAYAEMLNRAFCVVMLVAIVGGFVCGIIAGILGL